jgi:hypothetical protein
MAAEIELKIRENAGLLADDMISPPKADKDDDKDGEGAEDGSAEDNLQASE